MKRMLNRWVIASACVLSLAACQGGEDGKSSLLASATEAPGTNCEFGGTAISTGMDMDGNGELDPSEITATTYVCHGANGEAGTDGVDGTDGLNGTDGTDAAQPIMGTKTVPAGDDCEFGGIGILVGLDSNGDNVLDEAEITSIEYICKEAPDAELLFDEGALLPATDNCPGGPFVVKIGHDDNNNNTLEQAEVAAEVTSCNQAPKLAMRPLLEVSCDGEERILDAPVFVKDTDGSIESTVWELTGYDENGEVETTTINSTATGLRIDMASASLVFIKATATDNRGSAMELNGLAVNACGKMKAFHGVLPSTCEMISVEKAGDDRGGAVLSKNYVYYNGDNALVRMKRDGSETTVSRVINEEVDIIIAAPNAHTVMIPYHEDMLKEDGSIDWTKLNDSRIDDMTGITKWAMIDEAAFTVQTEGMITLEKPMHFGNFVIPAAEEGGSDYNAGTTDVILASTADAVLFVGRHTKRIGSGPVDNFLRYTLYAIDGTVISSRDVPQKLLVEVEDGGEPSIVNNEVYPNLLWRDQETDVARYPLTKSAEGDYILTYKSNNGNWSMVNLKTMEVTVTSETFAENCDVSNLALDMDQGVAWFHDEGSCFSTTGFYLDETLFRCSFVPVPAFNRLGDEGGSYEGP